MRWAVIGDVGGHHDALRTELTRLGVDPDAARIPSDLTLVQVGDLVHRGPASEDVVVLVDRLLRGNPGRWIQLVGNHESLYVSRPAFRWKDRIGSRAADTLRGWWAEGLLHVAAVVPTPRGDVLVTHAGLTEGYWREDLGSPTTAAEAARLLDDSALRLDDRRVFRPGGMLTGETDHRAGPIWADAARELLPSWEGVPLPFGQVHGHSSLIDWDGGDWRASEDVVARTLLDLTACHETTLMDGGVIVGVDPHHGTTPRSRWHAWEPRELDPV